MAENQGKIWPENPDDFLDNEQIYMNKLENISNWSTIPLLNYTPLHRLKGKGFVRIRGLIIDMMDAELYFSNYDVVNKVDKRKTKKRGKYRDMLDTNEDEYINYSTRVLAERRKLFLVTLPGINRWASDYEEHCNKPNIPKLQITDADQNRKRVATTAESCYDLNKRMCLQEHPTSSLPSGLDPNSTLGALSLSSLTLLEKEYLKHSPIPDKPSRACIIKVYDNTTLALNTFVDVVGFISLDETLSSEIMEIDPNEIDDAIPESFASRPPKSLMPSLHAVVINELPHTNPLLDMRISPLNIVEPLNMSSIRKDLLKLLTLCLLNDDLAAEYLLSHLISTVHTRTETQAIGKFSLNLCNLPKASLKILPKVICEVFEQLLPATHYLPMTLDNLNNGKFSLKRDEDTGTIISAQTQLAAHTHIILDETEMQEGTLEATGVAAIQHIASLINNQNILFDFNVYNLEYNVNIPVLIVSEGRSVLPNDFLVPISADGDSVDYIKGTVEAAKHFLNQHNRTDIFRRYITKAKTWKFDIDDRMSEMIQNDFVEMRKSNKNINANELHELMVLSRSLGIARGKSILDHEAWDMAKEMQTERRLRVLELPQSSRSRR